MVPLPKFDPSKDLSLIIFFKEFDEATKKYNLPEYDQFILLKDNVLSSALTLMSSLEPSDQGYTIAKNNLTEAFVNPESEKFRIINY